MPLSNVSVSYNVILQAGRVADPCLDFDLFCAAAVSCVSDNCGECSAILFDDAGYFLDECNTNSTGVANSSVFAGEKCLSDLDCAEDGLEYGTDGTC